MKNNATPQIGSLDVDCIGQELIALLRELRPFPAPVPAAASDVLPALSPRAIRVLCDCAAFDFCRGDQQLSVQQTVTDSSPAGAGVSDSICCRLGMMPLRCAVLGQVGQWRGARRLAVL